MLRSESKREVAIRDAYRFPTVRKLARHLASLGEVCIERKTQTQSVPSSREVFEQMSPWVRRTTSAMQAVSIYLMYAITMAPVGLFLWLLLGWYEERVTLLSLVGWTVAIAVVTAPFFLLLSIAAKWALIGRYRPGRYPLWGFFYFRWWLASRLQAMGGGIFLVGTPLMSLYYRLMGAKVGRGCILDTVQCGAWDLVQIGDETSIGADTQVLGYRVENGMIEFGSIEIGDRCFVGVHSALGLNVKMGNDSRLDDQSMIPDGQILPEGACRRGSPAQPADVQVPEFCPSDAKARPILFSILHIVAAYVVGLVFWGPGVPFLVTWIVAFWKGGLGWGVFSLILSVPIGVFVYAFFIAGLRRMILPRAEPGVHSVYSLLYLRKWLSDGLMKTSRALLLPLYTTVYFPSWLRLMGAKIGRRAELSTVWYFSPETLDVGDESFFADGCIVGGKRFHRGLFRVGFNRIGKRTFVGNSSVVPTGVSLGDRCLLGVQSLPPIDNKPVPDGTEWLGSPSFSLPNRPKVGNFDDSVTFCPTKKLYAQRAVIDAIRILIPGYLALGAASAILVAMYFIIDRMGLVVLFALSPIVAMGAGAIACLAVIALKWIVMGRFKPVIVPLWSMYVWLNEMINGCYESVVSPGIAPLLGTPFLATWLRLIGCKIGKHTYIASTLFSEFDLVEVGDYASLNLGSVIQTHLFEDRVMKSAGLRVGEGCSVGNMAVVLYNTEMEPGAVLGPLSLLMKGETLTRGAWHGIPTVQSFNERKIYVPDRREAPVESLVPSSVLSPARRSVSYRS
jgi:non-ribosomal peptide synthetase-like protein